MFDTSKLAYGQEEFESDQQSGERISETRLILPERRAIHLPEENKAELRELFHRAEFDPYAAEKALKKITELVKGAKSKKEKEAILTATLEKVFHLAEVIEGQFENDSLRQRETRSSLFAARNEFIRFFNAEMMTDIANLDQFYQQKTQKFLTKFISGS